MPIPPTSSKANMVINQLMLEEEHHPNFSSQSLDVDYNSVQQDLEFC